MPLVLAAVGCGNGNSVEQPAKFTERPETPPTTGGKVKKETGQTTKID